MSLDMKCGVVPCRADESSFVFISYAHNDAEFVFPVIEAVAAGGYKVWYDRGIDISATWSDEIAGAIASSRALVVFVTKSSMASSYVRSEIEFALNKKVKVIPVYLEGMDILPPGLALGLNSTQGIQETDPEVVVSKICAALEYNRVQKQPVTEKPATEFRKFAGGKKRSSILWGLAALVLLAGLFLYVRSAREPAAPSAPFLATMTLLENKNVDVFPFDSTSSPDVRSGYAPGILLEESSLKTPESPAYSVTYELDGKYGNLAFSLFSPTVFDETKTDASFHVRILGDGNLLKDYTLKGGAAVKGLNADVATVNRLTVSYTVDLNFKNGAPVPGADEMLRNGMRSLIVGNAILSQ